MQDKVDLIVEQNQDVWKSKSNFFSFLKGIIRKGWVRHPVKIKLLNKHRKQITNPNPRGNKPTVWGAKCSICNEWHVLKNIEVDHCSGETASLTKQNDIQSCVEKLLLVTEDDLRIVCKECHGVVTLSQKLGITFDQAMLEKKIISFKKLNKAEQIYTLTIGHNCEIIPPTIKGRVDLYRSLLEKESNE